MKEVSILLGAGFSIPRGYPSGAKLNALISSFNPKEWTIGTAYELIKLNPGQEDVLWYSTHNVYKYFLYEMMYFFMKLRSFDYEEFYDFLSAPKDYFSDNVKDLDDFLLSFKKRYGRDDLDQLAYNTITIYNKYIPYYLKDSEGNQYYESIHLSKNIYPGYTGFLNMLEYLGEVYDVVHIHTLNHDLLFETFNYSDWLNNEVDDGFNELGSPYFGQVEGFKRIVHKVRLPYYTNSFGGRFRLYKLHGSLDYIPFHGKGGNVEAFIKTYPGIRFEDFFKEISVDGKLEYHNDWVNLHSDFLSGTNSKILRYRSKVFYSEVFDHFENNLTSSERLIIFGYGCRDIEINNILIKHSTNHSKRPLIFEPYPNQNTMMLRDTLSGKIVPKKLEEISKNDLNPCLYFKSLKKY